MKEREREREGEYDIGGREGEPEIEERMSESYRVKNNDIFVLLKRFALFYIYFFYEMVTIRS